MPRYKFRWSNLPTSLLDKLCRGLFEDASGLDALLEFLRQERGFDFTGYKKSSVARRVRRRMKIVGVETFAGYLDMVIVRLNGPFS